MCTGIAFGKLKEELQNRGTAAVEREESEAPSDPQAEKDSDDDDDEDDLERRPQNSRHRGCKIVAPKAVAKKKGR